MWLPCKVTKFTTLTQSIKLIFQVQVVWESYTHFPTGRALHLSHIDDHRNLLVEDPHWIPTATHHNHTSQRWLLAQQSREWAHISLSILSVLQRTTFNWRWNQWRMSQCDSVLLVSTTRQLGGEKWVLGILISEFSWFSFFPFLFLVLFFLVIDANSVLESGLTKGNIQFFGSFDDCLELEIPSGTSRAAQYCTLIFPISLLQANEVNSKSSPKILHLFHPKVRYISINHRCDGSPTSRYLLPDSLWWKVRFASDSPSIHLAH